MLFNIESLFDSSKLLFDYLTKTRGYNNFLIDEIDSSKVSKLGEAIISNNRLEAIRIYLQLDKEMDSIRDKYCYDNQELSYKSNFRAIAKDLYRELKDSWLIYNSELGSIARIIRFISTSDYYVIREYLVKRSLTMYMYLDIPLDPDSFYCGYIPLEAFLDYAIKLVRAYMKE